MFTGSAPWAKDRLVYWVYPAHPIADWRGSGGPYWVHRKGLVLLGSDARRSQAPSSGLVEPPAPSGLGQDLSLRDSAQNKRTKGSRRVKRGKPPQRTWLRFPLATGFGTLRHHAWENAKIGPTVAEDSTGFLIPQDSTIRPHITLPSLWIAGPKMSFRQRLAAHCNMMVRER